MSKVKDKLKAITDVINAIEKQFGKGALMRLNDETRAVSIATISTGSVALDRALGIGGLPRGRLIELYGPESSGKTTIALHAIAEAQRAGGLCAFIDAEHALDISYAQALGVQADDLLLAQPDNGEQALDIADHLIRSGAIDLIVIDSVAALVPKAELEGDIGDIHVGLQARLMSQAMRMLTGTAYRQNVSVLFINQTRQKIGVTYGSNQTTTGGTALKFYASVRMEVTRIGQIKENELAVGNRTRVKVVKNKMAAPFRQAEFDIVFGRGIHAEGELVDMAVELGLVKKSGAWFALGDQQLGQGRAAACQFLLDHPDVRQSLWTQCLTPPAPAPLAKAA